MKKYVLITLLVFGILVSGFIILRSSGKETRIFYDKARNITPEFTISSATPKFFAAQDPSEASYPWESGNAIYHVFYTLREFLPERDEGKIDRANMYRLLYDVDTLFNGVEHIAVTLPTLKVITPPYNFGNNKTYEKAANDEDGERGVAVTETDTTIEAIVTWIWRDPSIPSKMEVGVFEASLNKSTNDLTIDFGFSVDYDTSDPICTYNQRAKLSGNTTTHAFEYKFVSGGASESDGLVQIVGKGVSKGQGNKFLFKVKHNIDNRFSSPRYLVLDADTNEDSLKAIDVENETYTDPNSLPADVSNYKDYVVNTPFFEHTDLLVNRNDLNNGNPRAGTIYLNY